MKIKIHSLIIVCWLTLLSTAVAFAAQEGTQAPGFNLRDLKGNVVTLELYTGKVVLLVFWAPWCIPCRDELPEIDRLYKKYKDKGFEVIGICEDAAELAVTAFIRKVPVSFSIAIDTRSSVADAYRLSNLPTGYLIDRNGVIRHRYRGFDKNLLKNYETDILELLD